MNRLGKFELIKIYIKLLLAYLVIAAIFHYAAGDELYYRESRGNIEEFPADHSVGEITAGRTIEQYFLNTICFPQKLEVLLSNYDRGIGGDLVIELRAADGTEIFAQTALSAGEIGWNQYAVLTMDDRERNLYGVPMKVVITSVSGMPEMSATALYNASKRLPDSISEEASDGPGRGGQQGERVENGLYLDGEWTEGALCIAMSGKDAVWTGSHFWEIAAFFALIFSAAYWMFAWRNRRGKKELLFSAVLAMKQYSFLMEQMVSRDFKVRYKRSLLGILWSFFNPLLTMMVQFIVFSQLFKSDISNIAVYMLSGLIIFNFFTEAVGQALGSIVYNAPLITKVYVPKYIYPVTKVLFSAINFLISIAVLLIVLFVTGGQVTKAFLLLPFLVLCVMVFSAGFGMLLASLMVFFRDIQFLWGIFSLLWMYMTPLFYPETLIAERFRWIFTVNPMYYYVKFMRSIVLDGISPEPRMYVLCAAFAFGALLLGGTVFKKTQNKFILNI